MEKTQTVNKPHKADILIVTAIILATCVVAVMITVAAFALV